MQSVWRSLFGAHVGLSVRIPEHFLRPLEGALAQLQRDTSLAQAKAWQPELVRALEQLELPAWLIAEVISDHNDLLYRTAIERAIADMIESGWGRAPVKFCVLVMGSSGRHESLLHPDQDNALILDTYPDERHNEIDGWFQTLGERFTSLLHEAGIPFCKGHVMASMPLWRKPINAWREQMALWMTTRRIKVVQQSNILFDFMPVYGDQSLADSLRDAIMDAVPGAGLFLHEMADLIDEIPVALDRFDRLQGDGRDAPHPDAINLKRQGLLPMTGALRLLALRCGCREVSTRARAVWLEKEGVLARGQGSLLCQVSGRLTRRLLDGQMATWRQGGQPDNWIDLRALGDPQLRELQQDLKAIRQLQRLAQQGR
ncbi:putative signal-transduction protein [Marinobacterium lacunae]|uniref:Putative signal-transduction protein n=1 Tax=Marinobacterium lacunae TaxID=1232683 RepID=A0A081FVZ2_9GAMM|nr:DUF294 nucleotidyltransferase-like domain-containing protein [Marinobacterium lacunae]KEA62697.1 putative signal-transduction protein [Marinobacterium lacunae]